MGTITLIVRGTTSDHDTFIDLATQARVHVTEHEPDTILYECYTNPATSHFVWHEIYRDDQAALQHIHNLMGTGLPLRVAEVVDWEAMTVLGVIENEDLLGTLKGMCAEANIEFRQFSNAAVQMAQPS
jgi:quinol monooxygenase YgiN